jgi:hypothetical protein
MRGSAPKWGFLRREMRFGAPFPQISHPWGPESGINTVWGTVTVGPDPFVFQSNQTVLCPCIE